jgi:formate hydrogenlyase subunit 6/NADH:ubiquinone oxidoreductase subunit I
MIFPGSISDEAIKSLFKKPATTQYPFTPPRRIENYRGRIVFDPANCSGCRLCMKDCPSNAIEIKKVAEKKFCAEIDGAKCIYCAQCVDTCPKGALESTGNFELAELHVENLKMTYGPKLEDVPARPDQG